MGEFYGKDDMLIVITTVSNILPVEKVVLLWTLSSVLPCYVLSKLVMIHCQEASWHSLARLIVLKM